MKCLYSNNFIKLERFYDSRIEIMFCGSGQRFTTEDIYIQ